MLGPGSSSHLVGSPLSIARQAPQSATLPSTAAEVWSLDANWPTASLANQPFTTGAIAPQAMTAAWHPPPVSAEASPRTFVTPVPQNVRIFAPLLASAPQAMQPISETSLAYPQWVPSPAEGFPGPYPATSAPPDYSLNSRSQPRTSDQRRDTM